ncbi:MAG: branched-chain amino acid ABC transporter substrate-binding protein [Anaerolineaceae bacterium]|nr:branched-chain amino acid ABC transporter substrate-binding protein [Anaerolineaceae bacterium]
MSMAGRMRRLAVASGLCLVMLFAFPLVAEDGVLVVAPDEPVALGVMTRSSAEGDDNHVSKLGLLLAQAERPGLSISGRNVSVELIDGDSGCDADQAAALAAEHVAQGRVAAIVGPNCSSACMAVAPLLDEAGYTSITPSCTLPALSEQGFSSFHRLVAPDTGVMAGAAHYLYEEVGARRVAIVYSESNLFYQGLAGELDQRFSGMGGEIVGETLLPTGMEQEALDEKLREIAAAGPDWLFCSCDMAHTLAVLAGREAAGLGDLPFLGNELGWANSLIDELGAGADGLYGVTPLEPDSEAATALKERFEAAYGEPPSAPYFLGGYDAWHILLDAIEAVAEPGDDGGLRIDRAALLDYVDSLEGYEGASGTITCQPGGECVSAPSGVFVIEDGEINILKRYGGAYGIDWASACPQKSCG